MTPEEQDEFNQMSQTARDREQQLIQAQEAANQIARAAQTRENELAERVRQSQHRETELAERVRHEQNLRAREHEFAAHRANELYDRLAYDRINQYVLASVPLAHRFALADRVAVLARERLVAGRSEPLIINELVELVRNFIASAQPVAKAPVKRRASSKKAAKGRSKTPAKARASSKKKTSVKRRVKK